MSLKKSGDVTPNQCHSVRILPMRQSSRFSVLHQNVLHIEHTPLLDNHFYALDIH